MFSATTLTDGRDGIAVAGEVDIYTVGDFREPIEALIASGQETVYLDFSDLDYIDSTGIGVLIELRKQSMAKSQKMILVKPKKNIEKLFKMTGVDQIFEVVEA